jgi:DNA modification methylase
MTTITTTTEKEHQIPPAKIFYQKKDYCTLYLGDVLAVLKQMPDKSVDVILCSPPYWKQRFYDVPNEIGQEDDYEEYLAKLLTIFWECKRVLKDTGSLWVIIDDSYNTPKSGGNTNGQIEHGSTVSQKQGFLDTQANPEFKKLVQPSISRGSKLWIPWELAIALCKNPPKGQGWCGDQAIWAKPNPSPESAKRRFTTSWEPILWFTKKSEGYYFDTRYEPFVTSDKELRRYIEGTQQSLFGGPIQSGNGYGRVTGSHNIWVPQKALGRIVRDIWNIASKGFEGNHYASYPPELCIMPIEATCPRYICNKCGHMRKMEIKKTINIDTRPGLDTGNGKSGGPLDPNASLHNSELSKKRQTPMRIPKGLSDCGCNTGWHPGVVLDIFAGVCTTGLVALRLGRNFLGIDAKEQFLVEAVNKVLTKYLNRIGEEE